MQIASQNQSQYNFVVQTQHSSDRPVISLEPAQKPKRIATTDQWITAFQTFVAIYMVRSPTDAPALMKYSETVQDLAANNAHWRYYDENFRFLRQKTLFSLGTPHAKVPYGSFFGLTQQAYKVALSVRLLLEISQKGKVFRL